jgi:hypothetical protein
VDAGSVLGLPDMRPSFLDDVSATKEGRAEAAGHACGVGNGLTVRVLTLRYKLDEDDDDPDADPDDDDDFDQDFDEDDDEESDEEEPETWQVSKAIPFP